MENAATMQALLEELGYTLQGLMDKGYDKQLERILYNASSDFHITFPEGKKYFVIFAEGGILKYYAFDTIEEAEKALTCFKKIGDTANYRIVPRTVAEMIGREHEFYQYCEIMTDSDAEAVESACRQQEIIDFLFSKP